MSTPNEYERSEAEERPAGYCSTCRKDVDIDGRPGDEAATVWSHLRIDHREIVVPGHAPGCWGDCDKHGCPVPVPDMEVTQVECGPVTPRPRPGEAPA